MKRLLVVSFLVLLLSSGCKDPDPVVKREDGEKVEVFNPLAVKKTNQMKLWVHYMPWFEDKASSDNGKWGQHWTMANKNPDVFLENGQRQIASHYYPLIGPYASGDVDVLEYHFLLMKYAGIDGILIDWYGTRDLYDYPLNRRNTEAIVTVLNKVGLEFAIVYEDQTLKDELNNDSQRIDQAIKDMQYLDKAFFKRENYIQIDGKPLLMTFGPQVLKMPQDWHTVLHSVSEVPGFFPLYAHASLTNNTSYQNAMGEYIWVDATAMDVKYAKKTDFKQYIGAAYPGFDDYYKEGGWGNSPLNAIAYHNGNLFEQLLKLAQDEQMKYLQLITWNDFGEGTMIEPTKEFQYTFLESIQRFTGVAYKKEHLEASYKYFNLKKQWNNNASKQEQLQQVFYYLISLQYEKAIELMDKIGL